MQIDRGYGDCRVQTTISRSNATFVSIDFLIVLDIKSKGHRGSASVEFMYVCEISELNFDKRSSDFGFFLVI